MDSIRIATEFNTHFVETGPKLSEIIDSLVNPLKYVKCNKTHIKLPCISEDKISRTINSLRMPVLVGTTSQLCLKSLWWWVCIYFVNNCSFLCCVLLIF